MTTVAVSLQWHDGDVELIRSALAELIEKLGGVDVGSLSTPEGSHDLREPSVVLAETEDGKTVRVRNAAAYRPTPARIERRAFRAYGELAELAAVDEGVWIIEDEKDQRRYVTATAAQVAATAADASVSAPERELARVYSTSETSSPKRKGSKR